MPLWAVIYRTNTGFVYGWVCRTHSAREAAEEFWRAVQLEHISIMCIARFESDTIGVLMAAYSQDGDHE